MEGPSPDAPAFARLTWMRERFAEGHDLSAIADVLGATERDIRAALRRAGIDPDVRPAASGDLPYAPQSVSQASQEPTDLGGPQVKSRQDAFDRLKSSEPFGLLLNEMAHLAAVLESEDIGGERKSLGRAIRILAHRQGREDTRRALVVVAAEALTFADRLSPPKASNLSVDHADLAA